METQMSEENCLSKLTMVSLLRVASFVNVICETKTKGDGVETEMMFFRLHMEKLGNF
jgi:hypothetical protein